MSQKVNRRKAAPKCEWFVYMGRGGAVVELDATLGRASRWRLRFGKSEVWHGEFKSKFDALCYAAWKCGRSMQGMMWEPDRTTEGRQ